MGITVCRKCAAADDGTPHANICDSCYGKLELGPKRPNVCTLCANTAGDFMCSSCVGIQVKAATLREPELEARVGELEADLLKAYDEQRTNAEQLATVREFCAEFSHHSLVDKLRERMLWADSGAPPPAPAAEADLGTSCPDCAGKGWIENHGTPLVCQRCAAAQGAEQVRKHLKLEHDLGPDAMTLSIPELLPMLRDWPDLCHRVRQLEHRTNRPAQLSKRTWKKLNQRIDDTAGNLRAIRDERITALECAVSGLRGRADASADRIKLQSDALQALADEVVDLEVGDLRDLVHSICPGLGPKLADRLDELEGKVGGAAQANKALAGLVPRVASLEAGLADWPELGAHVMALAEHLTKPWGARLSELERQLAALAGRVIRGAS